MTGIWVSPFAPRCTRKIKWRLGKEQAAYREEARELMRQVQEKCLEYDPDRKVSPRLPAFDLHIDQHL